MLLALILSPALVLSAPAPGSAIVIVREDDSVSADLVMTLVSYHPPEFTFWPPKPDNIDAVGSKLHLMPYYLAEGAPRQQLDADVKRLLESAQKRALPDQPMVISDALQLAFHLPLVPPDPRNQKIIFAQKRLIDAYLRLNAEAQAAPIIEDYVTRQPLDMPIELSPKVQALVARIRRQPRSELSVEVPGGSDVSLSIDGQDFDPLRTEKLLPGTHEVVLRFGQKLTGLLHRIDVSGKSMQLSLEAGRERALAFTPSGFVLRRGEALTPGLASYVADGTNVASVWLVEKKSELPPALLVTVAQEGKVHSALVNLRKDTPLRPAGDVDARKRLVSAIVATGQVALAEQPLVMSDYDVTRGADGLLTLLPRDDGSGEPLYKKWWLWTAVGAVVAGGIIATSVAVATHQSGVIVTTNVTPAR